MGAHITLSTQQQRAEFVLFHEGPSRIVLSSADPRKVEDIAARHGVECIRLGVTIKDRLRIDNHAATWIDCRADRLRDVWENALEYLLEPAHV